MWQVTALPPLQQFWHLTDTFVTDFLTYALALQAQNLSTASLVTAAATPPGKLREVATERVQDYLVQFSQCGELRAVVQGFRRTVKAYQGYQTYPTHALIIVSAPTHDLLHQAFKYFYDQLLDTKCFRETYLGMKGKGATGRQYRKLFGGLHRTCPYCDLELIAKVSNSQIDHFFAKAHHPLLAVHWANLVVSCYSCNAGVKLTTQIGHHKGSVENLPIFHPFYDQAGDQMRCCFNRKVTKVWIRSNGSPGTLTATKVRHWSRVFGLETQYEAHLPKLRDLAITLRDRAKQTYRMVVTQGGTPQLDIIYDKLLDFEATKAREQRGREPGTKLTLDFLDFLRTRRQADLDFIRSEL